MAEKLLTVRQVQHAGDGDHADGGGLFLRVRAGSGAWVFRFTSPTRLTKSGKPARREMGLGIARRGNSAEIGACLKLVRKQVNSARAGLQQGLDPIDERDRQREASKAAAAASVVQKERKHLTLARAARDYHERVIEPRMTAIHARHWISSLENHVPPEIWHKPIAEIDAPELLTALSKVRHLEAKDARIPETLRRIRQRLDAVWEDAVFHSKCSSNPAAAIRRKMRETLPRDKPGEMRALDYREAPAFMTKLQTAPGTAARCLEFAVLTAARTAEALTAEWSEFNLDEGVWTIPAAKMKAGEKHVVYLSKRAREIIAGQVGLDPVYLFPSTRRPRLPMSNMAMLVTLGRLCMRGATTVHGLCRATFSTWANEKDVAKPDVIEACLAHQEEDRVRRAYNRAEFNEQRRRLMDEWASYLTSTAQVIPFQRAA